MKKLMVNLVTLCALMCASLIVYGAELSALQSLQNRWAEIKYNTPSAAQQAAYETLITQAAQLSSVQATAEVLIWEGIIRSTYAGAKGGLGALAQVKKAKALFEQAIQLQPDALSGSAYTSLGSLYYQVPGWPVSFGDDKKASEMLLKGLSYNPDGIDSNYFYGDFLLNQQHYPAAIAAFEKALNANPRPGRELADAGRRVDILLALAKAKKH